MAKKVKEALGQGAGVGSARQGIGGADYCVCPRCGFGVKHAKAGLGESQPCSKRKCPKCGSAMKGTNIKPANIKESTMNILEASTSSWATINKSQLPASCFLIVGDPNKKETWKLPIYEAAGKSRGQLNLNGLRVALQAIGGSRTGKAMSIPASVRARITALAKTHKIGQFAESIEKNLKESAEKDILILSSLKEANIDKENKIIRDVVLLSRFSANNREYTPECLQKAVPMFEGIKAFLNHQRKRDRGEGRDVKDLVGRYKNVRVEDDKLKGDLNLLDGPHAGTVLSIAEDMPDVAGNSIHAQGRYRRNNGKEVVEELTKGHSVDLVTDPATTASLFEETETKEEKDMEWGKMTLAEFKINRADLYEAILAEGVSSRDDEVKTLGEERDQFKKDNDELKVKEAVGKKGELVDRLLNESELPDEAKTDTFRGILIVVQEKKEGDKVISVEDQVKALIEDRKSILDGKKGVHNSGGEKKIFTEGKDVSKEDFAKALKG